MTVKTIYVFRHGQTDYNATRRAMGQMDIPLNETGLNQAGELAQKMVNMNIQAIYTSPLQRAMQTAQQVANKINTNIISNSGLMERNLGVLQGHIVRESDNPDEYQMDYEQLQLCMPAKLLGNNDWKPDGGESRNECLRRAQKTIKDILKKTPYDTIAISTHTGPMLAILDLAGGTDKRIGNCDYVKLIFDGKKFSK